MSDTNPQVELSIPERLAWQMLADVYQARVDGDTPALQRLCGMLRVELIGDPR